MNFYPARFIFNELPSFDDCACERGGATTRSEFMNSIVQELGYMEPVLNGEFESTPEVILNGLELVSPVPGIYFYKGRKGEKLADIMQNLMDLAKLDIPEAKDFVHLQEFYRLGENPFNNVPDPLPFTMLLPVPVSPKERQVSDIDFINEYARAAIYDMRNDEYYGPYITELLEMPGMSEAGLLAMMVAVARAESGENSIGRDFFHRYEPPNGDRAACFSYSCFHVLMDKSISTGREGAGIRARRQLDMSEGQTYNHYNACKLFLAFLVEKAFIEYEEHINGNAELDDPEKIVLPAAPSGNFQMSLLGDGGNLAQAIRKADTGNLCRSYSPYVAKLEACVKYLGREVTALQPEDGVGMGYDNKGLYVVFFNSETGLYSAKLRVDYAPATVMYYLSDMVPNGDSWDHEAFAKFYCGTTATDSYKERLAQHFDRVYSGLEAGVSDLYEQVIYPFYLTFSDDELEECYGESRHFDSPGRNSEMDRDYEYVVNNAYSANDHVPFNLRTKPKVEEYKAALRNYIGSNYSDWPMLLRTDQIALKEINGDWRLIFCRDRYCEVVEMGEDRDRPSTPPSKVPSMSSPIEPVPVPPRPGAKAPEEASWSYMDMEARERDLVSRYSLTKLRVVQPNDFLSTIIRDPDKFGLSFYELPAKEPYEEQILDFLRNTGSASLMLDDYIGYGRDARGPYFICCLKNGHCSDKLYGPN